LREADPSGRGRDDGQCLHVNLRKSNCRRNRPRCAYVVMLVWVVKL
jgi:hypothetical protein